ncbi:MAG: hypothetical protein ACXWC1_29670 [Burkholderiales bacterium]
MMSWDSEFAEPIDLPNNVVATTLRQATAYISELPDAEQNSREWQNARQRILDAANRVGAIWFARIAIIRALQRDRGNVVRRDFKPRFKKRSWIPEELTLLNKLVVAGASPGAAAEALNRTEETVRIKARMIGCPFPHRTELKRRPKVNRIVMVSSSDAT